jgi:hypothetical protein
MMPVGMLLAQCHLVVWLFAGSLSSLGLPCCEKSGWAFFERYCIA